MNETSSRMTWFALGLIALVGTALRIYGIETNSLWLDELASLKQSSEPSLAQVIEGMRGNVHPPGWAVLLHFTQKIFGDSMTALRLPSVVAGILSVPAIFFLGRYLYSEKEGLISAAIMAVSWAPISFSHEARAYSLLILLSIVSTHLLLLVLQGIEESKVRYRYVIAYVLVCAIGCYQHYSFVVLTVCQGLWAAFFVVRQRQGFALLLGAYLVLLLLYVPWLREIGTDLVRESFWADKRGSLFFVHVFSFFFMKSVGFAALPFALLLSLV
ncbi:MAG: glycosyltransferase family 39 protein, partial [Pseudomonadota bacterium]